MTLGQNNMGTEEAGLETGESTSPGCDCCCAPAETAAAATNARCPRCGQPGQPVALRTLKHQVKPEHLEAVQQGSFSFCRAATCDVVYFSEDGVLLSKGDVRQRVGLKETEDPVPLCYCFGFTEAMVKGEIRATGTCTIPQRIAAEVRAGHCACEIRNPQGSCCLGNVHSTVKKMMSALQARISPASD